MHEATKEMLSAEEGRSGALIVATLAGGALLLASLLASRLFSHPFNGAALAMVAAVLLGAPIVWRALVNLWAGRSHLELLAALGILASFAAGEYFASGAIAFFIILSTLMEQRSALGARKSIEELIRLAPTKATLLPPEGGEREIEVKELKPGDKVRVRPGDRVPGDGVVVSGEGAVDQSSITGESMPADKQPGDEVFAGTINLSGSLTLEMRKTGEDTTLGQVKALMLQAEKSRSPVLRLVDQYAGWYTPVIFMLAGAVLLFTHDLNRAIAMLVISCPCAIILSGPTAMVAALSAAARLGVLIKNVSDLETARQVTAIVFDKTGTLTLGRPKVARLLPQEGVPELELLRTAALVEAHSTHPLAKAVLREARGRGVDLADELSGFEELHGRGARAVLPDGTPAFVGRRSWLDEMGVEPGTVPEAEGLEGLSVVHVAKGSAYLGCVGLEDQVRPGAAEVMAELSTACGLGKRLMLTGDQWAPALRVAKAVACSDVIAEVLPEQKLEAVKALKREGYKVAVVGDGVNDAPALACGDISLAMGAAGSAAAIHSASVALMNNELNRIPFLLRLSRKTSGVIRQNLTLSIGCVAVLLFLSASGELSPVRAAMLHALGAFAVIFNSARLVREGEGLRDFGAAEPAPKNADGPESAPLHVERLE